MCKRKGEGPRCSHHLAEGVTSAVAAFAAVAMGMRHSDAAEMLEDLEREAGFRPAPTSAEVADFLREQEWRVRHSPVLTEPKRQSILNRLRAAISQVPQVTGAKFAAWKAALGEAWARTRKKVAVIALAGAVAFTGGCGNTPAQHASPAPDRPAATATANPASEPGTVEQASFAGTEAATVFGQQQVDQGYRQTAVFADRYGFDRALLCDTSPTAADFEGLTEQMTPTTAVQWRGVVQKALSGDQGASRTLWTAAVYDVPAAAPGFTCATDGALVSNRTITSPVVAVDRSTGSDRLSVKFHQHGEVQGTYRGHAASVSIDRDTTYFLTPAPAGSRHAWLIDGWAGTWRAVTPDA